MDDTQQPGDVSAERAECLIITAPEWFGRTDFLTWLRDPANGVATWDGGGESTEYSDVFMTFDGGSDPGPEGEQIEGSHFGGVDEHPLPADIEREIKRQLCRAGLRYGVVRIRPA